MEIASATPPTSPIAPVASGPTIPSDYETFLNMLTVQMKNQDPLNPIESSDFAVQLATFSLVEQQTQSNDLLSAMLEEFGQMNMTQLAGWIGHEARAPAAAWVDGAPVTISPNPAVGAQEAVLVVRDAQGTIVSSESIPVVAGPMEWLGTDALGNPLPTGAYTFTLESYANDEIIAATPVEVYGTIIEAKGSPEGTILVMAGGIEVPATAVTALRAAD